jgi:hypothetical protein
MPLRKLPFFHSKAFEFHTAHSPSDCVVLLQRAADSHLVLRQNSQALQGRRTIRVHLSGDRLKLTTKHSAHSPVTALEAKLTPLHGGTRITGHIRLDWGTRIVASILLAFLTLFGAGGFLLLIYGSFADTTDEPLRFIAPLIWLGFSVAMLALMASCMKTDEAPLLQFLAEKLHVSAPHGFPQDHPHGHLKPPS